MTDRKSRVAAAGYAVAHEQRGEIVAADFLVKGILIGLLFGIPVGAVGTLTIQRAYRHGFAAGLKTGLGSSVADCMYAACGAFGLTLISDFLLRYQTIISIAGSCLILAMGVQLFIKKEDMEVQEKRDEGNIKMFLSAFAVGITNPAAILTFLFAFSYFGIAGKTGILQGIQLVAGVFIGTFLWWLTLSASVVFLRKKTGRSSFRYMNQIFGTILVLFGTVIFIRVIF